MGRGALIGAGIGLPVGLLGDVMVSGALSLVASVPSVIFGGAEETISTFPILTIGEIILGAGIGALAGCTTKQFRIDFDVETYKSRKGKMVKYAIKK